MTSITDMVQQHLGDDGIAQLTQHLGVDPATAKAAAAAALPMLVNAMSSQSPQSGAGAAIPGLGAGGLAGAAGGLLGNLFGGNHAAASQQLSHKTGIDIHDAEKALLFLAPIVMAKLMQQRQQGAAVQDAAPVPGQAAAPEKDEQSGLGGVLGAVEKIFHRGS